MKHGREENFDEDASSISTTKRQCSNKAHGQDTSNDTHSMHGAATTLVGLARTHPKDHVEVALEHATKPELATVGKQLYAALGIYPPCGCTHSMCKVTCRAAPHLQCYMFMCACVTGCSVDAMMSQSHLSVKWKKVFLGDSPTPARMHEEVRSVLLDLNSSDSRSACCMCQPLVVASDGVE